MWICMCPHVPAACEHMQSFMWRQPPHAMCTCKLRVDTRKILMCPHVKSDLCMIFFYFFFEKLHVDTCKFACGMHMWANIVWTRANEHVDTCGYLHVDTCKFACGGCMRPPHAICMCPHVTFTCGGCNPHCDDY